MLQAQENIEQSITMGSAIQTDHHLAILLKLLTARPTYFVSFSESRVSQFIQFF